MGCIFLDSHDRPCGQPTLASLPWCQPHVEFILAPAAAAATQPDPDDRPLSRDYRFSLADEEEHPDDDDDYIVIPPPEGYDFDDRFAPPHARPRLVRRADLLAELDPEPASEPDSEPVCETPVHRPEPAPTGTGSTPVHPPEPNLEGRFNRPHRNSTTAANPVPTGEAPGTLGADPWPLAPGPSGWRACAAVARSGDPCRARPLLHADYCLAHDPASRDQFRELSRKGGQSSGAARRRPASLSLPPLTTRTSIQATLEALIQGIIAGGIPLPRAHAIARILAVATRNFDPYIQSERGATPFHNSDHYRRLSRLATFPTTPTGPDDAA
jgi:hypothetical protein